MNIETFVRYMFISSSNLSSVALEPKRMKYKIQTLQKAATSKQIEMDDRNNYYVQFFSR